MKEIIFKYLKRLNINGLATFKNGPAIFLDQAPDDSDSRWDGSQYGRIIYGLNLKDDSERKVSGTMEIAIAYLFNNQGYKNLLEAKKILKKAFEGVFLTDEDTTISLVWRKSESFQEAIEGQMDVEVCGSVLTFDAYAFPKHSYLPLDAVGSLAKHIDENWNVTVINNTELDEIWKPDDEEVVVYTRLDSMQPGTFPSTYACTWFTNNIKVHVISGSDVNADQFVMNLLQDLQERERFVMNDGSPFFVNHLAYSTKLDPLKDGQVTVRGQYGKLRDVETVDELKTITIS